MTPYDTPEYWQLKPGKAVLLLADLAVCHSKLHIERLSLLCRRKASRYPPNVIFCMACLLCSGTIAMCFCRHQPDPCATIGPDLAVITIRQALCLWCSASAILVWRAADPASGTVWLLRLTVHGIQCIQCEAPQEPGWSGRYLAQCLCHNDVTHVKGNAA